LKSKFLTFYSITQSKIINFYFSPLLESYKLRKLFKYACGVRMRKLYVAVVVAVLVMIIVSFLVWNYLDQLSALKHETDRWAAIQDVNGDRIAVEPTSDIVWEQLVQLHENKSERFVGSIIEEYGNKWGFRFKPENITIAEVTVEGMQATIRHISEDLDYWLELGLIVYVSATVTEIHSEA